MKQGSIGVVVSKRITINDNNLSVIVEEQEFYAIRTVIFTVRIYLCYATLFGPQRWMYINKIQLCVCVSTVLRTDPNRKIYSVMMCLLHGFNIKNFEYVRLFLLYSLKTLFYFFIEYACWIKYRHDKHLIWKRIVEDHILLYIIKVFSKKFLIIFNFLLI